MVPQPMLFYSDQPDQPGSRKHSPGFERSHKSSRHDKAQREGEGFSSALCLYVITCCNRNGKQSTGSVLTQL